MADETVGNQGNNRQIVCMAPYPAMVGGGSEDQIDFVALGNVLWRRKLFIVGFTVLVTLLAAGVTFLVLPVTYQSRANLIQNGSGGGSKLGGLASLAGSLPIPMALPGGGADSLQLLIFLQSLNLKMKLIEKYDLLPHLYTDWRGNSLWDPVEKKWRVDNPRQIPTIIAAIQKEKLKDIFQVVQDDTTQLITITWVDEDPAFAAEMLNRVIAELDFYLANGYVSDAKRERIFVEKQLVGATEELEYWEKQVPSEKLPLTKITREVLAASNVYVELRKQVELARFTEEKEIINFKTIDPPFVPEVIYKPRRLMICAAAFVGGGLVSIVVVLVRHGWRGKSKKRKREAALAALEES